MNFSRVVMVVMMVLLVQVAVAQQMPDTKNPKAKMNQLDSKGRKTGTWVNNMPEDKGNAPYTEFGSYLNGMKNGLWYKMNIAGDLLAIENYKKDYFDGEVKYFTKGQVTVIGLYRALNPDVVVDTIVVEDPVTGIQQLVTIYSDRGTVRHGTWRFYNEYTGAIEKVEEYQVDSMIYEEFFQLSKADSLYYERRNKNMPHVKKGQSGKPVKGSYLH